jgi:putative NADH-flavin reductase
MTVPDYPHVAVLGATGRTGHLLVTELLDRGHSVSVLVRDPSRLGSLGERAHVVTGSSDDAEAVTGLLDGANAVASALGPVAKDGTLHQRTASVLIPAMRKAGIHRFVGISGAGIDVPGDQKSLVNVVISKIIQTVGGAVVKDKPVEYEMWAASGLDWTLVRPPRLKDGAATGRVEHDAHRSTRSTSMTRGDLAVFVADVLEQNLYINQAPFAASAK